MVPNSYIPSCIVLMPTPKVEKPAAVKRYFYFNNATMLLLTPPRVVRCLHTTPYKGIWEELGDFGNSPIQLQYVIRYSSYLRSQPCLRE